MRLLLIAVSAAAVGAYTLYSSVTSADEHAGHADVGHIAAAVARPEAA